MHTNYEDPCAIMALLEPAWKGLRPAAPTAGAPIEMPASLTMFQGRAVRFMRAGLEPVVADGDFVFYTCFVAGAFLTPHRVGMTLLAVFFFASGRPFCLEAISPLLALGHQHRCGLSKAIVHVLFRLPPSRLSK
jgi:hypothetical protein